MRRRLWNRTRTGLRAGFGQLESWASGLRGVAPPTSKQRATRRPALGAEPLEARLLLDAMVSITAVDPDLRNTALNEIAIEFTEPVSGFDTTDLIFSRDGASVPLSGNQLTTANNQSFRLTNLALLTGAEGNYQLTLDVLNSGISPLSLEGLGVTPGPELVENGTFDRIDQLAGWVVSSLDGVRWELAAAPDDVNDGVARITSLHPTINDPDLPIGSPGANIQQEFVVSPNTTYRVEFDLISTNIGGGSRVDFNIFEGDAAGPVLLNRRFFAGGEHEDFEFVTGADSAVTIQFIASRQNRDFTVDNVSFRRAAVVGPFVGWTMDTTAPTVTISAVDRDPRNTAVDTLTIAFDEPIENFNLSDLSLTRDSGGGPQEVALGVAQLSTSDNTTWTLSNLTPLTSLSGVFDYELKIRAAGTGIQDPATNPLGPTSGSSWRMDTVAPIVTIAQQLDVDDRSPPLSGTVNDSTATITVTVAGDLYEAVNNLNGTWSLPGGVIEDLADGTYNVIVTATDPAGNPGTDITTNDLRIDAAPRVTVDKIRTADQTPRVTGTIDDPLATISRLIINGVNYDAPAVINHGDGTWELPDDTILVEDTLPEGKYDVSFVAFDTTGHFTGSLLNPIVVSSVLDIDLKPIVINEIMFRPESPNPEPNGTAGNAEPTDEEFVELYNNSVFPIDVSGWEFTRGFRYTIPNNTTIPPHGYLVVASDVGVFTAKYDAVPLLVGGDGSGSPLTDWIGTLSNSGENIRFERFDGALVDRVRYADSGDWAVRRWVPNFSGNEAVDGWQWIAPHDGDGHSLELMNPELTNREGQNWAPSAAGLGTPGVANSAATRDVAPLILDVENSPAIPHTGESVVVTAMILNEGDIAVDVMLYYRVDPQRPFDMRDPHSATPFIALPMVDDGTGNDVLAGDGIFSATVPGQIDRAIVDFYVEASERNGANVRSYPAPSDAEGHHDANLLYQVDDSIDLDFADDWPGDQPIYRLVMTAGQEAKLRLRDENGAGTRANDEVNATFIVRDPGRGVDVDNGDLAMFQLDELGQSGSFELDADTLSILLHEKQFVGGENIDALHVRDNGKIILSTTSDATLGGLSFSDGDLVEYDLETATARLIFSEGAFGSNEDINAIWVNENPQGRITELIFSTDGSFSVGDTDFANADLVKIELGGFNVDDGPLTSFAGLSVTRVFSESLFAGGANIDGLHVLDNGNFLLSTTGDEQLAGLAFTDGSIVEFHLNNSDPGAGVAGNSQATLFFGEANFSSGDEDINALFVDEAAGPDGTLVLSTDGNDAGLGSRTEVFHNVGVRIRGNASRAAAPFNLRIAFPADHQFRGESSIPLNSQAVYSQLIGQTVFEQAGLSTEG
ncbi:MAG: lamin tail domain-containing protein, partial [Planctomycetes bacterium]|nr:lamin tail domain-containing protein [Planctomycetota bacterium]